MSFDVRSFCKDCGSYRRTLPFGVYEAFFDRGPCASCGGWRRTDAVARRARVGRWPWQRGWTDENGVRVDVPVVEKDAG